MRLLVSGRRVVAPMPRLVKTGVIVALLAVFTLGGLSVIGVGRFAVPMAHAASGCTGSLVAPAGKADTADIPDLSTGGTTGLGAGMKGDAHVDLWVYNDSLGNFCGNMAVQAWATLYPGSHGGYLWGGLYDCTVGSWGNLLTGTNVKSMSGNGTSGSYYTFWTVLSSQAYTYCGYVAVEAWSYPYKGVKAELAQVSSDYQEQI